MTKLSHTDQSELRIVRCRSLPRRLRTLFDEWDVRIAEPPDDGDELAGDFPGWVVFHQRQPAAFAGFCEELDGSLSLMPPVLLTGPDPERADQIVSRIVESTRDEARRRGATWLRCVISAESEGTADGVGQDESDRRSDGEPAVAERLLRCGFRPAARIGCWMRPITGSGPAAVRSDLQITITPAVQISDSLPAESLHRSVTPANATDTGSLSGFAGQPPAVDAARIDVMPSRSGPHGELLGLLDRVFATSQDLPHVPRPTPQRLLASWQSQEALIITARQDERLAGVLVLSASSGDAEPGEGPTMEFVGTDPDFRRQGVASALLTAAWRSLTADAHSPVRNRALRAFVDDANPPAVAWYRRHGFLRVDRRSLLMLPLDRPTGNASPDSPR